MGAMLPAFTCEDDLAEETAENNAVPGRLPLVSRAKLKQCIKKLRMTTVHHYAHQIASIQSYGGLGQGTTFL